MLGKHCSEEGEQSVAELTRGGAGGAKISPFFQPAEEMEVLHKDWKILHVLYLTNSKSAWQRIFHAPDAKCPRHPAQQAYQQQMNMGRLVVNSFVRRWRRTCKAAHTEMEHVLITVSSSGPFTYSASLARTM